MSQNERAHEESRHRDVVQRYHAQREKEPALVEQVHRAALERYREQSPPPSIEPPAVHHTELPEARPGDPVFVEWNCYRREVGRLLVAGQAGRFVLIHGEAILGIWDTREEALAEGRDRCPGQTFLVHQIQERERMLRCLSMWPCRD
jgi:hypothetical protein